jgi:hypothetical protein
MLTHPLKSFAGGVYSCMLTHPTLAVQALEKRLDMLVSILPFLHVDPPRAIVVPRL